MAPRENERLLGHVAVDSGIVAVGDPCYLVKGGSEEEPEWQAVVRAIFDPEHPGQIESTPAAKVSETIMTRTEQGDDLYPVYAEFEADGRLTGVRIDLRAAE